MNFLTTYTQFIEEKLQDLNFPEEPKQLYEPIRYFLSIGGKRIRPILTLFGAEMFGLEKEKVINAALAIEVFHNFTLLHDDIMDEAPLRRNMPTVHQKWNANTAILSGDALMIKAYELLQEQPGDLREMLKVFNRMAIKVCQGQQQDMDFEQISNISIQQYETMIGWKTSVLLACALEISAIVTKESSENRENIANFGFNIGLAFQIMDDLLDLYADPTKFGKQIGGDIIANKKTMLYLVAQENANKTQTLALEKLKNEQNNEIKIKKTTEIFNEIGVKELTTQKVNYFFDKSQKYLKEISVPDKNKEKLIQLSYALLGRTS